MNIRIHNIATDEILAKIEEAGFKVAMQKEINLSKEQAEEFYKEHKEEAYFEELTTRMTKLVGYSILQDLNYGSTHTTDAMTK